MVMRKVHNTLWYIQLKHINKISKHRQSLYSIEFVSNLDTIRSRADTILDYDDDRLHERDENELSPKPMTPRRVKRRSVMARGTNSRTSTTSRRSQKQTNHREDRSNNGTYNRSSMRASRRKHHQNPVTKILDQQEQLQKQHTYQTHHNRQNRDYGSSSRHNQNQTLSQSQQQLGSFHRKDSSALTASNLQTLNQEILNNSNLKSNILASGSLTKVNNNHYTSFQKNIPPDPIYYNTNGQSGLFHQQNWQAHSPVGTDEPPTSPTLTVSPAPPLGGHFNPTYQHSTTNLNDVDHVDELYNNRPPSVRSSYSNFHGTRPLSTAYVSPTSLSENVFAGLPGTTGSNSSNPPNYPPPSTPPLYGSNVQSLHQPSIQHHLPLPSPSYVPSQSFTKRSASRESIRSMAFLNNGPPAYNLNYHTPPDSETTM